MEVVRVLYKVYKDLNQAWEFQSFSMLERKCEARYKVHIDTDLHNSCCLGITDIPDDSRTWSFQQCWNTFGCSHGFPSCIRLCLMKEKRYKLLNCQKWKWRHLPMMSFSTHSTVTPYHGRSFKTSSQTPEGLYVLGLKGTDTKSYVLFHTKALPFDQVNTGRFPFVRISWPNQPFREFPCTNSENLLFISSLIFLVK